MRLLFVAVIAACLGLAQPAPAPAAEKPTPAAAMQMTKVNLNTASIRDLQALPGIGQVTAERIVSYRTEKGPFAAVDDLTKVKGIGKKSLEKLRGRVAVE